MEAAVDRQQAKQTTTGAVLIASGILLFISQLDWGPLWSLGRLWPVVLIAVGLPSLLFGDKEGNRGGSQLQFTVSRSGSGEGTVRVDYRTVAGTALAKSDYDAASGTLTFPPGVWSRTITITVKTDRRREPNETFTVELLNAVGASVNDAVATGTILNDD